MELLSSALPGSLQARTQIRQAVQERVAGDGGVGEKGDAEPLLDHLLRGVDVVELHDAARDGAGTAEELVRQPVIARRAVEEDQLHVADLLGADRLLLGEAVLRVDDENEVVLVERRRLDLRVAERTAESEVDLLLEDELEDLFRVARANRQLDPRMCPAEAGQDPRQDVRADRRRRTERELAALAASELAEQPPARRCGAE